MVAITPFKVEVKIYVCVYMSGWRTALGVTGANTHDDIARKYKKLILKTHPNKGGDAAEFRRVRSAWERYQQQQGGTAADLHQASKSLRPLAEMLKKQYRGKSVVSVERLAASGELRSMIDSRLSRFTSIGRLLRATPKTRVPAFEKPILRSRLQEAIETALRGVRRSAGLEGDIFWGSLALYVALEYQLATLRSRYVASWPIRADTGAPVSSRKGLRYKLPAGFEHIHNAEILGMANRFGSRYAQTL